MANIIDGKAISAQIKEELKEKVAVMEAEASDPCCHTSGIGPGIQRICRE